jgi:hypothetical protein
MDSALRELEAKARQPVPSVQGRRYVLARRENMRVNGTDAKRSFLESLRLHDALPMLEDYDWQDASLARYDNGVLGAAAPILAKQESDRIICAFEALSEGADTPLRGFAERASNLGLLIALFASGREAADGGVEILAGKTAFGDHPDGLSEIRIDVAPSRGDFQLELLITWEEFGPNPAYYELGDKSADTSLSKRYELALIRDQGGPGEPALSDRKTRRIGIESLNVMVETYTDREAARDPFGVALRAYQRIARRVADDFTA